MITDSVFTTALILDKKEVIHFVFHDEEGDWHFMPNRAVEADEAAMASVNQMLDLDASLEDVLSLPCGSMAERKNSNKWLIKKM